MDESGEKISMLTADRKPGFGRRAWDFVKNPRVLVAGATLLGGQVLAGNTNATSPSEAAGSNRILIPVVAKNYSELNDPIVKTREYLRTLTEVDRAQNPEGTVLLRTLVQPDSGIQAVINQRTEATEFLKTYGLPKGIKNAVFIITRLGSTMPPELKFQLGITTADGQGARYGGIFIDDTFYLSAQIPDSVTPGSDDWNFLQMNISARYPRGILSSDGNISRDLPAKESSIWRGTQSWSPSTFTFQQR